MLDKAIDAVRDLLARTLAARFPAGGGETVILGSTDTGAGEQDQSARGLVVSLVGIGLDTGRATDKPIRRGDYISAPRPMDVEATLVLTPTPGSAARHGFEVLTVAIDALRQNPVLSHANAPGLAREIERLSLDPVTLPMADEIALRQAGGLGLAPLACFRLHAVGLDENMTGPVPIVSGHPDPSG